MARSSLNALGSQDKIRISIGESQERINQQSMVGSKERFNRGSMESLQGSISHNVIKPDISSM
jgi:hypothetical protein